MFIESDPTLNRLIGEVQQAREDLGLPKTPDDYSNLPLAQRLNVAAWAACQVSDYDFRSRQTHGDIGYSVYKFPGDNLKDQAGFLTTTLEIEEDDQTQLSIWAQYKSIKRENNFAPVLMIWARAQDINGRGSSLPRCLGLVDFVEKTAAGASPKGAWIGEPEVRVHIEDGLSVKDIPTTFDDIRAMNMVEMIDATMRQYFARKISRFQKLGRQALGSSSDRVIDISEIQSA